MVDSLRLYRPLLWSILCALALYGIAVAVTDGPVFLRALGQLEAPLIAAILALSLGNYALRYLRWHAYLCQLAHRLPHRLGIGYFLAGFALTTTPGKAGEAVRSVFLKRHGVGYVSSLAVFFSERLVDVVAMLLLAMAALVAFPETRGAGWAILMLLAVLLTVIHRPAWQRGLAGGLARFGGDRLASPLANLCALLAQAAVLLRPGRLAVATLVGLLAWSAEGLGFYLVVRHLGFDGGWPMLIGIYAIASLIGALSMLPGGLGGAEAAMVSLLVLAGCEMATAVAATVICRMATLWFAVVIGVTALSCCGGRIRDGGPVSDNSASGRELS